MNKITSLHYDIIGIGFGPSNIAIAIAAGEKETNLSMHFLEAAADSTWQPGMLLNSSDIQNNPVRDLVTPRNPQSYFTFINYLHTEERLFDYLNLGLSYPLRKEYSKYIKWAASHFAHLVSYRTAARQIEFDDGLGLWKVITDRGIYTARTLIIGTGRSRNIPPECVSAVGPRVFHACDYLSCIDKLGHMASVAVLGASQSAVELLIDLLKRLPQAQIHAIHRSFSMRQKDTSPFSDHVYFPEFVDYYYELNAESRRDLRRQLEPTNYKAADLDVLKSLYLALYEEKLDGKNRFKLCNNTTLARVAADENCVTLTLEDKFSKATKRLGVDALILATGFKDLGTDAGQEPYPALLSSVSDHLSRTSDGQLNISRQYKVHTSSGASLYLNGLCESSHGFGDSGSFSLLALRAMDIVSNIEATLSHRENCAEKVSSRPAMSEAIG